jgi:sugar phosphate permease
MFKLSVIVAMFLTAELCQFNWLGGWASSFYIYAFAGLAFCALWLAHVYDTPLKAEPRITDEELKFIHEGEEEEERGGASRKQVEAKEVPWAKILSSPVVWSTALCSFSQNFMNVGTVVYLPSYYAQVMKMNVSSVCAAGGRVSHSHVPCTGTFRTVSCRPCPLSYNS